MVKRKNMTPNISGYLGPEERWKMLGISIVAQAVFDWKEAVMKLSKPETASHEMVVQKRSAEMFLRSSKCEFYSGLDGKTLLRKLKEGCI